MTQQAPEGQQDQGQQQDQNQGDQGAAQSQSASWDDLFKDQDPAKVKEALDNSRKWETRAKENFTKAQQYDQLKQSQMTEQEKITARAEAAEKRVTEIEGQALRSEVALSKGLTPSQAKRLVGSTKEELESDADEMLADLKPGRPQGDVGQGHRGDSSAEPDMNQLIRRGFGR